MEKLKTVFLIMVAAAMLSIPVGPAGAQTQPSGAGDLSEAEALNTANLWASLVSKADIAGLEGLLNDKYIHIHATGLVESKAQFIEALKTGARKYDPIRIEEAGSRLFGNCAVVTGKFKLKAFTRRRTIEGMNRFSLVVIKTPAGFQVVSFQATGIPQQ